MQIENDITNRPNLSNLPDARPGDAYGKDVYISAVLGWYIVTRERTQLQHFEYAASEAKHIVHPQTVPIEIVSYKGGSRQIRAVLDTTQVYYDCGGRGSRPNTTLSRHHIFVDGRSTFQFADMVDSPCPWSGDRVILRPEYKTLVVGEYEGGKPMVRIVKQDGSPVGIWASYWSEGAKYDEPLI